MIGKLFKNIFSKEPEPVSLDTIQVDMHSHLVPGIDDGCKTVEESIEIIRSLMELGYKKAVTTPHVMSEGYPNTSKTILDGLEKVKTEIEKLNLDFEIEAAAEYYVDDHFEQLLDDNDILSFGDRYLLIEFSYMNRPINYMDIIQKIIDRGYKPILAHPERYLFFHQEFEVYQGLKNMGVYLQLNLFSLAGVYSPGPMAIGRKLIDNNLIDFLGTDIHNPFQIKYIERAQKDKFLGKLIDSGKLLNKTL